MKTDITLEFRVGDRIRLARRGRRMSQQDLAATVNVSRSMIGWWETGHGTPDLEQGVTLARALGVSLHWLATGTDDVDDVPTDYSGASVQLPLFTTGFGAESTYHPADPTYRVRELAVA